MTPEKLEFTFIEALGLLSSGEKMMPKTYSSSYFTVTDGELVHTFLNGKQVRTVLDTNDIREFISLSRKDTNWVKATSENCKALE